MALNYLQIGQRIRAIRKRKGLSQQDLSELIDMSPTFISYIENGQKSMSLTTFLKIANALSISTDELLVDNLNTGIQLPSYEFARLLSDCTETEKRILFDIALATKDSMRHNLSPLPR